MISNLIFHICHKEEWRSAVEKGIYKGSSQDQTDGFIHFSTFDQIVESAAKHRFGQNDLVLMTVDGDLLENSLKWELSRGGDLFPHLYGALPMNAVLKIENLPLGLDGKHIFPD